MIIKLKDQNELVPTSNFPYAKFKYDKLNPVQSRIFDVYNKDANVVIAAATSAGKTLCAEMLLSHEIHERGGKGMYLSPLRALSQEKIDDWVEPDHHFHDKQISICTGDYRLTPARRKEMDASDLIIFTSEMLNSRGRNYKSENNQFLKQIGTLVIDEAHLLTVPDRGAHLESGIMKFTELNPDGRIILLSATMPNVDEIGEWISHLTKRDTYLLESSYRPCPLNIHYPTYHAVNWYEDNEKAKVDAALKIILKHYEDKFLFFVHTKRTGELLQRTLRENMISCEYHNADLVKDRRKDIERRFKDDNDLRAIVATSTLAWGLNLPARRVVILGVHRGMSEVATYEIAQECGRAGRPQYDPQGDAYVLLPDNQQVKHKTRLLNPQEIESQMMDSKTLAFHLVSEIHHRNIQSLDDVEQWYDRTLAAFQNTKLDQDVVDDVVHRLGKCGAIRNDGQTFDATSIGVVSSLFYYSPYDVSDLARNWTKVFEQTNEGDDYWTALALANTDTHRQNIMSAAEREEVGLFRSRLERTNAHRVIAKDNVTDGALKVACCYHKLMNGQNSHVLGGQMRNLQVDFERLSEVLGVIDGMVGKWDKSNYWKRLNLRVKHGVGDELVDLVTLKGIGKVKANKLWDANLRSLEDVAGNLTKVVKALSCSAAVAEKVCNEAKQML